MIPWTPLSKPLAQCRVALVTSCGVHLKTDPPFGPADASFRELPADLRPEEVAIAHPHYDHHAAETDLNVVFPLERLKALAAEGLIGSVAPRHYGFMGGLPDLAPVVDTYGPEVARRLKADAVDIVLLTPC